MAQSSPSEYRVAVVQRPPVVLDRDATIERVLESLDEAAAAGARLVVFPETFISGYPEWVGRLRPGADAALATDLHTRLVASAVDIDAGGLAPVSAAAGRHGLTVVIGVDEIDGAFSRSTLYNTMVIIASDGRVVLRHRKLVPTGPERMVWGQGDGVGLETIETSVGRVGGLICFENYMPLARYALYAQGVQLCLAPTWDDGDRWLTSMRHIAAEGRCWVVSCGSALRASDLPADLVGRDRLYPDPDEWLNPGDSVIVDPDGRVVVGPLHRETGILYAECDPARTVAARRTLDVAGHYGRPDVFQLVVDRTRHSPVVLAGAPGAAATKDAATDAATEDRATA